MDKELYKSAYKNDIKFTQLILDVTSPTLPMRFQTDELIHEVESLTRGLCFALQQTARDCCKALLTWVFSGLLSLLVLYGC